MQNLDGVSAVEVSDLSDTADIFAGIVNIRSTTTGGTAFIARLNSLASGERVILAMTQPAAAEEIEIAPAFAGAITGTLAIAPTHTEVAEVIALAPSFAGTITGALARRPSRTPRFPKVIVLAPSFAGTITGALDVALEAEGDINLDVSFAGTIEGELSADLTFAPDLRRSFTVDLGAWVGNGEWTGSIALPEWLSADGSVLYLRDFDYLSSGVQLAVSATPTGNLNNREDLNDDWELYDRGNNYYRLGGCDCSQGAGEHGQHVFRRQRALFLDPG